MSNYTQVTFFAPKDSLLSGDPNKIIRGAQVDPELAAIATAIASKYDALNSFAAPIQFADGGVGAPGIAFHSETNTGIYKSAAHVLSITANGALEGSFGGGQVLGAPTGGPQGVGTLNATNLFINGAAVSAGAAPVGANPTTSVGLAIVNGSAATFMRSDGAPALSQAISPTWSGTHVFTNAITVNTGGSSIKGGLTIAAAAAGAALTVVPLLNANPQVSINGTIGASFAIDINNTDTTDVRAAIRFGNTLTTTKQYTIGMDVTGANGKAFTIRDLTRSANIFTADTNGQVVILAPASGNHTINGVAAGPTLNIQANGVNILQVGGTAGPTVQGYGPVTAGLVDMTPDKGTFTITYTGMTAGVTGTAVWSRNGNQVMLFLPVATGTSNATTMSATGIPAAINPTRAQWLFQPVNGAGEDNGASVVAAPRINTNNTIDFSVNGNIAGLSAWTASGTKGIQSGFTVFYLLN